MPNHSVTCGYARVSKADDEARNLVTKLQLLQTHGVPPNLVYRGVATGRSHERSGWQELVEVIRPGDTIVVAFLDRFSRNFEEGVRIQAGLVDATSERVGDGRAWARGEGRRIGRPPALSPEQVDQCLRMAQEGAGHRRIARVMKCSPATVKKALVPE